jgi:hypothetical protein
MLFQFLYVLLTVFCTTASSLDKNKLYTGCLKIREFRIQSVVRMDPVELQKKIRSS